MKCCKAITKLNGMQKTKMEMQFLQGLIFFVWTQEIIRKQKNSWSLNRIFSNIKQNKMKPQTTKKLFAFILIAIGMFSFSFLPAKDCAVLNGRKSFNQIAVKSPNEPTPVSLTTTTIATVAPGVKIGSYRVLWSGIS